MPIDLRGRDLDVLDVVAVPDRLEDRVPEPQHQDVLDGLFAEVVIDSIDLRLVEVAADQIVELARRLEVAAERLLDDHAAGRRAGFCTARSIRPCCWSFCRIIGNTAGGVDR